MFPTPDHKPVQGPPPEIRRVLLGTDLGHTSELATDRAFDLAQRHGADLLVVSVIDPVDMRQPKGPVGIRWDRVRDGRNAAAHGGSERRAIGVAVSYLIWAD